MAQGGPEAALGVGLGCLRDGSGDPKVGMDQGVLGMVQEGSGCPGDSSGLGLTQEVPGMAQRILGWLRGSQDDSGGPGVASGGLTGADFSGGELFMQLEREGIFLEDTAW